MLGLLVLEGPRSPYELVGAVSRSVGFFFAPARSHVYEVLPRLERHGWARHTVVEQATRPDKRVYRATAAGRRAIEAWVGEPYAREMERSVLLLKVYFGGLVDPAVTIARLEAMREHAREALETYREIDARHADAADEDFFALLTLRHGIERTWSTIRWTDDALARLRQRVSTESIVRDGLLRRSVFAAVALVALLLAACGGSDTASTTTRTASPARAPAGFDGCLKTGPDVRQVAVPAPHERLPAIVLGTGGSTGVVFANQSASTTCGWLPYARNVARDGVRSVVFDYAAASREAEILACAHRLREHGAHRVVLVGGSIGGRAVVTAAVRAGPRAVEGVISLSGERNLGAQPDLLPAARRLRVPAPG